MHPLALSKTVRLPAFASGQSTEQPPKPQRLEFRKVEALVAQVETLSALCHILVLLLHLTLIALVSFHRRAGWAPLSVRC